MNMGQGNVGFFIGPSNDFAIWSRMLSCSLTEILKIVIYFKVCKGTAVVIDFGFKVVHKQLQEAQALW